MTRRWWRSLWVGALLSVLAVAGLLVWIGTRPNRVDPVVGSWYVTAPDAPYPHHMFTFHTDHTMTQANPDAGNQQTSDSDGAGMWARHGATITGLFMETTADRRTGTAEAHFYDLNGTHVRGPLTTPLRGQRITPSLPS